LPTYKYAKKCPLFRLRQYGNPIYIYYFLYLTFCGLRL